MHMCMISDTREFNADTIDDAITSKQARELYSAFQDITTARKFANNDFFDKTDQLVIIDFANAYEVMAGNDITQGICLMNMAIIHYNNRNYVDAAKNFMQSAKRAKQLFIQARADNDP